MNENITDGDGCLNRQRGVVHPGAEWTLGHCLSDPCMGGAGVIVTILSVSGHWGLVTIQSRPLNQKTIKCRMFFSDATDLRTICNPAVLIRTYTRWSKNINHSNFHCVVLKNPLMGARFCFIKFECRSPNRIVSWYWIFYAIPNFWRHQLLCLKLRYG